MDLETYKTEQIWMLRPTKQSRPGCWDLHSRVHLDVETYKARQPWMLRLRKWTCWQRHFTIVVQVTLWCQHISSLYAQYGKGGGYSGMGALGMHHYWTSINLSYHRGHHNESHGYNKVGLQHISPHLTSDNMAYNFLMQCLELIQDHKGYTFSAANLMLSVSHYIIFVIHASQTSKLTWHNTFEQMNSFGSSEHYALFTANLSFTVCLSKYWLLMLYFKMFKWH